MSRILPITPMMMRGLGPAPSLITVGFGPAITKIIRIIRGGRSVIRDIYGHKVEEFKIAAKLLEINGKHPLRPLFISKSYVVDERIQTEVKVTNVKIASKNDKSRTSVLARLLKVKRGINE